MKMYIMSALPEDHLCSKYADYLFEFNLCDISLEISSRNVCLNPIKQQRTNTAEMHNSTLPIQQFSHFLTVLNQYAGFKRKNNYFLH